MWSRNVFMDETFAHSYECIQLAEIPSGASPHYYFPGGSVKGGRDGLILEIQPHRGDVWFGTFAYGNVTPNGFTGVLSSPNPHRVCVVSKGSGYFVDVNSPANWEEINAVPILDVRPIASENILVFADFTKLVAYDTRGVKWRTEDISLDGLKITSVGGGLIEGEFWNPSNDRTSQFVVDLVSGIRKDGNTKF